MLRSWLRSLLYPRLLLAGLLLCAAQAGAENLVAIDAVDKLKLRASVEFLASPVGSPGLAPADLDPAAFRPLAASDLNRGVSQGPYWLRLRLHNAGDSPRRWVLHHETSYLDHLVVHYREVPLSEVPLTAPDEPPFAMQALSDRVPFAERPVPYRRLAFAHVTPPGEVTEVYLELRHDKADSITLDFTWYEATAFHAMVAWENLLLGVFYGAMGLLTLLALVCAALLRERVYAWYAAFLVSSGLMWAMLNGFAFQYLWPRSVFLHNEGFHIVYLLVAITALQFSRHFLQTARLFPRIHQALGWLQVALGLGIPLRLAGVYEPVLYLSFFGLALLLLLPLLAWASYRRGLRYTRWYALAWLVYAAGLALSVISAGSGWLNWGMEPLAYTQTAAMLEAILLLVALGERLMGWEQDRRQALDMANRDALTGLGNRRLLTQAFDHLGERFSRTGAPVFLVMIDIDHFKAINDSHGHEAGDEVLRRLAALLRRVSRPQDVCVRYGGEEFAVLLQTGQEGALQIAERVRREFASRPTPFAGCLITHTLSAGVAPVLSGQGRLGPAAMMRRADEALYRAKAAGRDRVVLFNVGAPAPEAPAGVLVQS